MSRRYRLGRRAEHVEQTRQRITEAAVRLHTSVGPSRASIAAIAEEAGVTRLTVYRHFRDLDELFDTCMRQWDATHPGPDPTSWQAIPDLADRTSVAFRELYRWYGRHAADLYPILRDQESMPEGTRAAMHAETAALAATLLDDHAPRGSAGRTLRAVARHLVSFWTWRSLARDEGLGDERAAEVAARLLVAVAAASADLRPDPISISAARPPRTASRPTAGR